MISSEKNIIESDDGVCFRLNKCLHRFQRIDQNLFNSLIYNYQWFSNPKDFNDPYDCNIELDYNNTPKEIESFIREVNHNNNDLKDESYIVERTKQFIENPELMTLLSKQQDEKIVSKMGLCCFSERDDSLLMWSHYGDSHKGVCLSFDFREDLNFFTVPYCVEYPEKYPKINFINEKQNSKLYRLQFATKSKEWQYEQEIRIIKDERKPPYRHDVKFKKEALSSIKFGYKSLEIDQIKIKSILKQVGGYEHVKFCKAKLKRFEFGMEYEEIFI